MLLILWTCPFETTTIPINETSGHNLLCSHFSWMNINLGRSPQWKDFCQDLNLSAVLWKKGFYCFSCPDPVAYRKCWSWKIVGSCGLALFGCQVVNSFPDACSVFNYRQSDISRLRFQSREFLLSNGILGILLQKPFGPQKKGTNKKPCSAN